MNNTNTEQQSSHSRAKCGDSSYTNLRTIYTHCIDCNEALSRTKKKSGLSINYRRCKDCHQYYIKNYCNYWYRGVQCKHKAVSRGFCHDHCSIADDILWKQKKGNVYYLPQTPQQRKHAKQTQSRSRNNDHNHSDRQGQWKYAYEYEHNDEDKQRYHRGSGTADEGEDKMKMTSVYLQSPRLVNLVHTKY